MKCFIIDDEEHAVTLLSNYVKRTPGLELCGSSTNPLEALQWITDKTVDAQLFFIDIDMPDLTCIELRRFLLPYGETIFSTAHPEFAVTAFDENALDYLLKPFTYERFLRAVNKAKQKMLSETELNLSVFDEDYRFVKTGSGVHFVKVRLKDILFVESKTNYIELKLTDKTLLTYVMINELEEQLPAELFFRIHKSYIVNLAHVKGLDNHILHLSDNIELPVGRAFRQQLMDCVHHKLLRTRRTHE